MTTPTTLRVEIDLAPVVEALRAEIRQAAQGGNPGGYTVQQWAEMMQVNVKTVYGAIKAGRVHAVNIGGARPVYRIPREWADQYMRGRA